MRILQLMDRNSKSLFWHNDIWYPNSRTNIHYPVPVVFQGNTNTWLFYNSSGGSNTINIQNSIGGLADLTITSSSPSSGSGLVQLSSDTGALGSTNEYVSGITVTQTAGTNSITNYFYLAYGSGFGTYNLSGAGKLSARFQYIGNSNTGTFTQSGGNNSSTGFIAIGSKGKYTLNGGTVSTYQYSVDGRFEWFYNGLTTGTLALDSSGTLAMGFDFDMATLASGSLFHGSTLTVSSSSTLEITNGATATQSGNTSVSIGYLSLGTSTGNGTYKLNDTGMLEAYNNEYIGNSGTGTFTQTGGTNYLFRVLYLGNNSGSNGIYKLSGTGILNANSTEVIGYNGTGTFTQTGGTNTISPNADLYLGYNSNSSGTYYLNGGMLILRSLGKLSGTAAFNFGGGTLRANGTFTTSLPMTLTGDGGDANIDTAVYSIKLSGLLSGTGGMNKIGSGTLTLSSSNSFTGPVNFNSGLINAGNLSNLGNGTALNFNGGGLQFSGVFDPSARTMNFQAGGATLDTQTYNITMSHPIGNFGTGGLTKNGTGKLTANAMLQYSGDTTIGSGRLEIAGGIDPTNGTSLIDVQSGTAALETVNVSKSDLDINTAAMATFEVVNGAHTLGAITGGGTTQVDAGASLTAASICQGTITLAPGATLTIAAIPGGPTGNRITPVPEPSAFALLSAALIAAFCYRLKKGNKS